MHFPVLVALLFSNNQDHTPLCWMLLNTVVGVYTCMHVTSTSYIYLTWKSGVSKSSFQNIGQNRAKGQRLSNQGRNLWVPTDPKPLQWQLRLQRPSVWQISRPPDLKLGERVKLPTHLFRALRGLQCLFQTSCEVAQVERQGARLCFIAVFPEFVPSMDSFRESHPRSSWKPPKDSRSSNSPRLRHHLRWSVKWELWNAHSWFRVYYFLRLLP